MLLLPPTLPGQHQSNEMMLLLAPTLLSTVLPLHSPPKTLSFQRPLPIPSHQRHHRPLLPIPTRPFASLSSTTEERVVVSIHSVLRSHDIPEDACTAILSTWPDRFLRMKPLKNLDPKLRFLRSSVGLSGVEVAEILLANPYLLRSRLHPSLSSLVTFLALILPSKEDLVRVLKSVICYSTNRVKDNLQALRDCGVTESAIRKILLQYPRSLLSSTEKFLATLEAIEKLGLGPTSKTFVSGVGRSPYITKATFSTKVDLLRELGWSEEQVFSMFRRNPGNLTISDAKLRKNVAYFQEVLGWGPELLCSFPRIIQNSLEKRIIPSCAVLNVLMMKGLLKKRTWHPLKFRMAKKRFFEEYVDKYREEVPEVLEAYQGNIEFTGWGWLKDVPAEEEEEEEEAVAPKSS